MPGAELIHILQREIKTEACVLDPTAKDAPIHDPKREQLVVPSKGGWNMFSFGTFRGSTATVRFVAQIDAEGGYAGFFWRLRDDPDAFPEHRKTCLAVWLGRSSSDQQWKVQMQEFSLGERPRGGFVVHGPKRTFCVSGNVPIASADTAAVELRLRCGRIPQVVIDGDYDNPIRMEYGVPLEQESLSWPSDRELPFGFLSNLHFRRPAFGGCGGWDWAGRKKWPSAML